MSEWAHKLLKYYQQEQFFVPLVVFGALFHFKKKLLEIYLYKSICIFRDEFVVFVTNTIPICFLLGACIKWLQLFYHLSLLVWILNQSHYSRYYCYHIFHRSKPLIIKLFSSWETIKLHLWNWTQDAVGIPNRILIFSGHWAPFVVCASEPVSFSF